MPALRGSVALIATFVGLVVTALITDGMNIDGVSTWILATIIVWLGGLLAGIILPMIFVKERSTTTAAARRRRFDLQALSSRYRPLNTSPR